MVGFFYFRRFLFHILRIFIIMRTKLPDSKKRIKLSITLSKVIHEKLESDIVNKSKLIEKLLIKYYDEKM